MRQIDKHRVADALEAAGGRHFDDYEHVVLDARINRFINNSDVSPEDRNAWMGNLG